MRFVKQLLLFALFVVLGGASSVAMAESLLFSCIEGTPDIEISRLVLSEAYGKLGIDITIQEFPGLRALQYANEGETDGELFRAKGVEADYPNLIRIQVPINTVDVVVLTKGLSFEIADWQSLKPYHIGIQPGITFIESNVSKVEGLVVDRVKSNSQLLQMLDKERLDAVVMPRISAAVALADLGIKSITILEPPLQILPLFHYLNVKHESLAPQLEIILQQMEDEGEIQRIRDEYISDMLSE